MKHTLSLIILLFALQFPTLTQAQGNYEIDFSDPESVVKAIFYAAQNRDFAVLAGICDPLNEGDGDTRRLCGLAFSANGEDEQSQIATEEFVTMFTQAKLMGTATIKEEGDQAYASVPFWFNHPGGPSRSMETMVLVRRYGNWYLSGF